MCREDKACSEGSKKKTLLWAVRVGDTAVVLSDRQGTELHKLLLFGLLFFVLFCLGPSVKNAAVGELAAPVCW